MPCRREECTIVNFQTQHPSVESEMQQQRVGCSLHNITAVLATDEALRYTIPLNGDK